MIPPTLEDFQRDVQKWLDGLAVIPPEVVWDCSGGPPYTWAFHDRFRLIHKDGAVVHTFSTGVEKLVDSPGDGFEPMPGYPGMFRSKRTIEEVIQQTGAWRARTCETCATNDVRDQCPPEHFK